MKFFKISHSLVIPVLQAYSLGLSNRLFVKYYFGHRSYGEFQ